MVILMDKLKKARLKMGFSYQKMADLLNISKSYYWQIENKKRRLNYELAIKIANIFNTKPDKLFYNDLINKKE